LTITLFQLTDAAVAGLYLRFDLDESESSVDEGHGAAGRRLTVVAVVFLFWTVATP